MQISGDAQQFKNERTLIVANHESFLDGVLLGAFLPVGATFVVHAQVLGKWYFRWLLRYVPHLAVDSASPLAIKLICRLVETGTPVVIFPEGRLTMTGSLMKVYDGAAFVAAKTGATIVPVRIEGSGRSYFGRLAGIYPLRLAAEDPHHDPAAAAHSDAAAALREAAAAARRRDHAPHSRSTCWSPRARERTLFAAFLDAKATFGSRLPAHRGRAAAGGVVRLVAAHGAGPGSPAEARYAGRRDRRRADAERRADTWRSS